MPEKLLNIIVRQSKCHETKHGHGRQKLLPIREKKELKKKQQQQVYRGRPSYP